ncbi:MAG: hypothetical protein G01um1014106_353 [Parcubacteria group bacterium Gr01-1014_106]|nr:MAG: hypothetical protein G01um1014106_353 [Parcubacteria group bacterium Gr01-1014_106]
MDERRALVCIISAVEHAVRERRLRRFFEGLMTKLEQRMLAQRIRIALLLTEGYSYRGIADRTGASFTTITAVDRWLRRENASYRTLYPLRHRRRPPKERQFTDGTRSFPGDVRGLVASIFGHDPRQR